jgi:predicted Rossmann fold nucleotide-binding protein DprA/Smf involved in DNA uptake
MSRRQVAALVGLSFVNGIGPKMFETLVNRFDNPEEILTASVEELCKIPRLTSKIAEAIHAIDLEAVEMELMALEELSITVITLSQMRRLCYFRLAIFRMRTVVPSRLLVHASQVSVDERLHGN